MTSLAFVDHRNAPQLWADALGISREAVELYLASDVIDLHVDSFIWTRIAGYDLTRRHGPGVFGARIYGQVDLPRLREARVTGAIWVITTNPWRDAVTRARVFELNLARLAAVLAACPGDVAIVRSAAEYRAAVAAGKHAAWIGVQGGNAFEHDLGLLDRVPDGWIVRVTVVHLSTSAFGATSAPSLRRTRRENGLTDLGREFVRRLDEKKIFVDLAHIHRAAFFDAVDAHDKSKPLIVTHTGVAGVHRHWRNLDDDQLRAVADTGGTVGVMYHVPFLGEPIGAGRASAIVDHLDHIVRTVGEDFASLGSDWDGAIVTPRDMPTCLELPRLVQIMLDRGWSADRVRKILGANFLRALAHLRG
jgi:membrane dipeptidase